MKIMLKLQTLILCSLYLCNLMSEPLLFQTLAIGSRIIHEIFMPP